METLPKLGRDRLPLRLPPLAHRLAQDRELPCPCLPADVREAQEVESLGWTRTAFQPTLLGVSPELNQPRFLRVQFQAELDEPLLERDQTAPGVGFLAEPEHEVVGVSHDDDLTASLSLPPVVDPLVENIMQEHIRQER